MFHRILRSVPPDVTEDRLHRLAASLRTLFAKTAGIDAADLLPEAEDEIERIALATLCAQSNFSAMSAAGQAVCCAALSYRADIKCRQTA